MMTGCAVVTYDLGALKEVIGECGFVVKTEKEFLTAMERIDTINNTKVREWAMKWDARKIVGDYIPLMEKVVNGLRW